MVLEHIGVSDEAHVEAEKGGKTMASSHYAYHQSIGYEQNAQRIDVTRDIKNQEILWIWNPCTVWNKKSQIFC